MAVFEHSGSSWVYKTTLSCYPTGEDLRRCYCEDLRRQDESDKYLRDNPQAWNRPEAWNHSNF